MPNAGAGPSGIDSADKALQLILLLGERESVRVSEVADALGTARSTAHRLLRTLRQRGFAVQAPDRSYRLGPALRALAPRPHTRTDLLTVALPHLQRLRDELDETVHLVVLQGADVQFLHSEEGRQALRISTRAGAVLPARLTSGGKVLLAALDPAEVELRYIDVLGPEQLADLHRQLVVVRRRGYGLNRGESEPGIGAVGVAIGSASAPPLAAISVSVPLMRLARLRLPQLLSRLRVTARVVSATLG